MRGNAVKFPLNASRKAHARMPRSSKNGTPEERAAFHESRPRVRFPKKHREALTDLAELPPDEEVLIPLYEAYREMDRALQSIYNWPRSAGARGPISDEQQRARDRAEAIAVKLSQLTSIRSFWTEIYQETMVSHCYYTGGDGAVALQVLAKANALPVAGES